MLRDFFSYSLNNISKRKLRSWLTMLGIFIGIASVVALIGLGDGLEEAVLGEFMSLGSDKITVMATGGFGPPGSSSIAELTLDDYDVVKNVKGFDVVTTRILKTVSFEYNDVAKFPFAVSMPMEEDQRDLVKEVMGLNIVEGRMLKSSDRGKVVVTYNLADSPLYDRKMEAGESIKVNGVKYQVIGILEDSGVQSKTNFVVINDDEMRDLLNLDDFISLIAGKVNNIEDVPKMKAEIERKLRRSRGVKEGEEDFDVQTPDQIIESFGNIFSVVTGVVVGIAAISLIVGAIGIMNTMFTAVLERRKEIGIMKAIGARNKDILLIFMMESGFLGLVGGIVGIIFGVLFAKIVEFGSKLALGSTLIQAHFSPIGLLLILSFSFGVGIASGLLPAKQASSLQPVKALRS